MTEDEYAMLAKLRAMGVRRAVLPNTGEIEFFPVSPEIPADMSPDIPKKFVADGPENCKCGHDETEHAGSGHCLRGCETDQCLERTTPDSAAVS